MKKFTTLLAFALAAGGVSATTTAGVWDGLPCKILFISFVVAPAVGFVVVAIEAVRWITQAYDPWARGRIRSELIYVTAGLVFVFALASVAVFLMSGLQGFYSCFYLLTQGESAGGASIVLSKDDFITTLSLYEGWNLFSTPLVLNNPNVSTLFGNVRYDIIYSWDAGSGMWEYCTPENRGGLTEIELDRGYWVHMLENNTVVFYGKAPLSQRNVSLSAGWNLVGYSGYAPAVVQTSLEGVDYSYIYGWNASQALSSSYGVGWSFHSKSGSGPSKAPPKPPAMKDPGFPGLANLSVFEQGRGYWIYVNQSAYWTYPTGYPQWARG